MAFSGTFVFTLINIAILFLILRAIFFRPVRKFVAQRSARIKGEIESAAKEREEARNLKDLYEEKLKSAEDEARSIMETSRRAAESRAADIVAAGKADAEALVTAARKQIAAEQQAAYLVFKAEAAALVVQAAGVVLQRELSGEQVRRLAEAALNECARGRA